MTRGKQLLLNVIGLIFSVVPVTLSVLLYFPLWRTQGSVTLISGFTLLLLILAATPLFNIIKEHLKSPSAHTLWFILFVIFFLLSSIARQMTVISFIGFLGNLIGSLFFRRAKRYGV